MAAADNRLDRSELRIMNGIQLRLFGYPSLLSGGVTLAGPIAQRHRLALLTLLARAPQRTLPREKLLALLWPDADMNSARHLMNTSVHVIRRELSDDVLLVRPGEITLASTVITDVEEFESLLAAGKLEQAVSLRCPPFLDAFFLDGATEFEDWAATERSRLGALYNESLEALAERAESGGDVRATVKWWQKLSVADSYNTRVVMRLMLALERAGDHGNAVELAVEHEALLARDLQAEPSDAFRDLVRRLRTQPNGMTESELASTVDSSRAQRDIVNVSQSSEDAGSSRRVERRAISRHGVFAVASLVLAISISVTPLISGRTPSGDRPRAMIAGLEAPEGDTALRSLAVRAADAVLRLASAVPAIEVLDQRLLVGTNGLTDGSQAFLTARRTAARAGAATLIRGKVRRDGDSIRFDVVISEIGSGRVLRSVSNSLALNDPNGAAAAARFGERILGALAMEFDDRLSTVTTAADAPPDLYAFREYLLGLDAFDRGAFDEAVARFSGAVRHDSSFTTALVWTAFAMFHGAQYGALSGTVEQLNQLGARLSPANRFGVDWLTARMKGDVPAAYRAAREAARIAPRSQWAHSYAAAALELRRPAEALRALEPLDAKGSWIRGWTGHRNVTAGAYHLLGRYSEEFALARSTRSFATNLHVQLISEARPLAAMGRSDALHRLIDEALSLPNQPNMDPGSLMQRSARELLAHGHVNASNAFLERARGWYEKQLQLHPDVGAPRWALGNILYALGMLDSAAVLYQGLLRPGFATYRAHGHLGMIAARHQRPADAAIFDSLLAIPQPGLNSFDASSRVFYRACIAALLRNRERAMTLLQEAVALGVPVPLDSIHVDGALQSLRGLPAFDQLVRIHLMP
jgi:DNA-binding SARP family transcriptional activator/tetratricopeptide (TPR) repeat protein